VSPGALQLDIARSPGFIATDAGALRTWLDRRYPGLGATGSSVSALQADANRRISAEAGTPAFFLRTYNTEVLQRAAAIERMRTIHGWAQQQVRGMKDFTADELRVVEFAFETLNRNTLVILNGVKLTRQDTLIERRVSRGQTRFVPDRNTGGLRSAHRTTRGGAIVSNERTITLFDQAFVNDRALFAGGSSGIMPSSALTVLHEVGHVVGDTLPHGTAPGGADIESEFNQRFAQQVAPITAYAAKPGEFFAEAFSIYYGDPEWLRTNLPDMYTWIDTLVRTGAPPRRQSAPQQGTQRP
jgi:hypothetical protein